MSSEPSDQLALSDEDIATKQGIMVVDFQTGAIREQNPSLHKILEKHGLPTEPNDLTDIFTGYTPHDFRNMMKDIIRHQRKVDDALKNKHIIMPDDFLLQIQRESNKPSIFAYITPYTQREQNRMKVDRSRMKIRIMDATPLGRKSTTDQLTGIYTRDAFITAFEGELAERNTAQMHGLMFFDLDSFKQINETYGHYAGDRAIIEFAHRLENSLRGKADYTGRFAGDEFLKLMNNIHPSIMLRLAYRAQRAIISGEVIAGSDRFLIRSSVGLTAASNSALLTQKEGSTDNFMHEKSRVSHEVDLAIRRADAALMTVKHQPDLKGSIGIYYPSKNPKFPDQIVVYKPSGNPPDRVELYAFTVKDRNNPAEGTDGKHTYTIVKSSETTIDLIRHKESGDTKTTSRPEQLSDRNDLYTAADLLIPSPTAPLR